MELQPQPPELASPSRERRRRAAFKRALIALGVLLLATVLLCTRTPSTGEQVNWLTPADLTRIKQPGPFTRLKYKFMIITAPLWRGYWNRQPQILIDSSLLTLSAEAVEQTALGAPVAKNIDGMRAWILSSTELNTLQERMKAIPGVSVISRTRIQTADAAQGQFFAGQTIPAAGGTTSVGVTVDLIPKIVSGSVRLTIGATSTKTASSPSTDGPTLVRTNFAAACRTLIPNGGGLVLGSGGAKDSGGQNHWLILLLTVVDARGNPIKL